MVVAVTMSLSVVRSIDGCNGDDVLPVERSIDGCSDDDAVLYRKVF